MRNNNWRNKTQRKQSQADPFNALTWGELQDWAGPVIVLRGRRYQHSHQVQDLARTSSGGLVAWVLILALERAGRREEIIPLCRQEAEKTGSYLRFVERLKKGKQWEEAEEMDPEGDRCD